MYHCRSSLNDRPTIDHDGIKKLSFVGPSRDYFWSQLYFKKQTDIHDYHSPSNHE